VDEQQPKDTTARISYESPRLKKQSKLSEVTEGFTPPVTDGAELEKGGCFGRDE
jgi:hypothetical protein